ncbi:MAG: hypothetical protein EHM35_02870 [Planctomycetaceae bacterium]|nr:MAG: hypothetical protein EHM35_02870 [Planctomycetaceae bacterium]
MTLLEMLKEAAAHADKMTQEPKLVVRMLCHTPGVLVDLQYETEEEQRVRRGQKQLPWKDVAHFNSNMFIDTIDRLLVEVQKATLKEMQLCERCKVCGTPIPPRVEKVKPPAGEVDEPLVELPGDRPQ